MTNTQIKQIEDVLNGFDFDTMRKMVFRFTRYTQMPTESSLREIAKELLETVIEHKAIDGFLGNFFVINTDEILELHSTFNHSHILKENYAKLGAKKAKSFDEAFTTFIDSLVGK